MYKEYYNINDKLVIIFDTLLQKKLYTNVLNLFH